MVSNWFDKPDEKTWGFFSTKRIITCHVTPTCISFNLQVWNRTKAWNKRLLKTNTWTIYLISEGSTWKMYLYTVTHDFQISSHFLTKRIDKKNKIAKKQPSSEVLSSLPSSPSRLQKSGRHGRSGKIREEESYNEIAVWKFLSLAYSIVPN